MGKKLNEFDLTEDEIAFLKSSAAPEVRPFLSRQHENLGTKTSAYRKVAAAMNAESDVLLAAKRREKVMGEMVEVGELRQRMATLEQERDSALARESRALNEAQRLKALPAQVVHSGGQ